MPTTVVVRTRLNLEGPAYAELERLRRAGLKDRTIIEMALESLAEEGLPADRAKIHKIQHLLAEALDETNKLVNSKSTIGE